MNAFLQKIKNKVLSFMNVNNKRLKKGMKICFPQVDCFATKEAELVYNRRRECKTDRIAVFSPLPPMASGVATFTFKLHYAASDLYDMYGYFDSEEEYRRQFDMYGDDFNVLPANYFSRMENNVRYKAKIYVIGNSPFHDNALKAAITSVGECNRHLYLHEAMVIASFFQYCKESGFTIESFLLRWYPELSTRISELSRRDFFEFCREYGVYGIRPLIRMTGIRSLIVNNKTCEDMIRADLPPEELNKVSFIRRYLPISDVEIDRPIRQSVPKGSYVVGTFGAPNKFKGTDRIVESIALLNNRGVSVYLVIMGFNAVDYVEQLPECYRKFCIVPSNVTDNVSFWRIMKGVDVAVQLRLRTLGESSGCISELIGMGVPVIVNKGFVEAPFSDFVTELSQDAQPVEIADELEKVFKAGVSHIGEEAKEKYGFRNAAVELFESLKPNVSARVNSDDFSLRPKGRKNLLFDVSQLAYVGLGNVDRDGIYFASLNILRRLVASGKFNISFFCRQCFIPNLIQMRNHDRFWALFPLVECEYSDQYDIGFFARIFQELQVAKVNISGIPPLLLLLRCLTRMIKIVNPEVEKKYKVIECSSEGKDFDIYFSPMFAIPEFIRKKRRVKKFVIVYDAIPTLFRSEMAAWSEDGFWYNELIRTMDRQTHYFAISECTKRDFIRITGLPEKCFSTMLIASANEYHRIQDKGIIADVCARYGIPVGTRYALSLCSINFRKNLVHGAACFISMVREKAVDDIVLVIGGGGGDKFLEQVAEKLGMSVEEVKRYVVLCGYVKDEDMSALYSGCDFFIYPSLYEGFGMPPLEAMQCGAPVITSNVSSLPEVVGDAAITVDPKDVESLVSAMAKLYDNPGLREELRLKGVRRAKMFSWDKTFKVVIDKIVS